MGRKPDVNTGSHPSSVGVLRPRRVARRSLPVNFRQDDRALFDHELERELPQAELLELRGVRVSADGLLYRGLKILPESFAFPFLYERWKTRSVLKFFATNYLTRRARKVTGRAAWITDDWGGGYFHWLADSLTRLYTIREEARELTLLLPGSHSSLGFVRPSLAPFGVRDVRFVKPDETLVCERLVVPMHTAPSGHYDEEVLGGVRRLLLEAYGAPPGEGERLYISRGRAPKRRIANEEEVFAVLRAFGFRVVYAEDHTFEEQVEMASRARLFVSNHGAGLTNMLFVREGGRVLELRRQADSVNNCYFTMASALGLEYFYQTCASDDPSEDPHTAHLRVDAALLADNIRLMLGG
jgi:capsular polysaccharide biosynthesis protein